MRRKQRRKRQLEDRIRVYWTPLRNGRVQRVPLQQLDGRAAILMVVARSRGWGWQTVRGSSARCPSRVSRNPTCSRHRAPGPRLKGSRKSRRARPRPRPIPPAIRIAGHLATSSIPQLNDGLSGLAAVRRRTLLKVAFVLLIVWLLGVVGLYNIGEFVHVCS